MAKAQSMKRKPQTEKKVAKAPAQKPEAKAADKKTPGYLQKKMKVSQPGDAHEQQAEQVAERVSRAVKTDTPVKSDQQQSVQRATLQPGQDLQQDETVVARKAADEEKPQPENLDRQADEETDMQEQVERQAESGDAVEVDQTTEERINALRGGGEPLPEAVKNEMQQQLQTDLLAVRIHTGGEAAALAAGVNARAFTVGNDVFFASGEYSPDSAEGRKLLAHELTHVAQQSGGVQRLMRAPADTSASGSKKGKFKNGELHVPSLTLPQKPGMEDKFVAKYGGLSNWKLVEGEERTDQVGDWKKQIRPSASSWDLKPYLGNDNQLPDTQGPDAVYALKMAAGGGGQGYLIGTESAIREQAILPWWTSDGKPHAFDVDHILELQLGGDADKLDNFQLLDAGANRSSGSKIKNAIDKAIQAAIPPEMEEGGGDLPDNLSKPIPGKKKNADAAASGSGDSVASVKSSYKDKLIFDEVKFKGGVGGNSALSWPAEKVVEMAHVKALKKATKANSPDLFANDKLRLMPRPGAGVLFTAELKGDAGSETFGGGSWGGMAVTGGTFNRDAGSGTVNVTLPKTGKVSAKETPLNFVSGGLPTLCHIAPGQVEAAYRHAFKAKTLSPIELSTVDLDASANIVGGGVLTIDGIPLLAGTTLDVSLVGGDLVFSKTFATDEFDIKGPIQLDSSSLTLSAGASTPIEAGGVVEFHIGELAKGSLSGRAAADGFAMTGQLEFDKQLFTGSGSIDYDSAKGFKASGTLGLKPGALKGVKKASFTLSYDDDKKAIDFGGDAELSVPGFKGASLAAHADEAGNISLGGEAQLSDTIPRIKAGKLSVNAERKGEVWSLGGGGELEPDLAGLDASAKIKLDYQDGVLTGKVKANYKRSMVAGSVDLNAKAIIGEGSGEAEPLKVWGSGTVDVTAAPWLKATVGLTLDENGEVTVSGELGLPSSLELFPRKEVNKPLFGVATQVPIVPGVVAEVGGNLSAKAGIGPGALNQLKVGLTYNPDHEENTKITGAASLKVPADAGLRLAARAGIGLGITGASATGGLEIGGTLGVDGAAEAAVDINWTPTSGLDLTADLSVHAQPSFTFDVSGYVAVTVLGASLYEQRWQLAAYEFGSNYRFGISLPVHYHEGQAFNISLDDVKFEVPDISPSDIVNGLISKIV